MDTREKIRALIGEAMDRHPELGFSQAALRACAEAIAEAEALGGPDTTRTGLVSLFADEAAELLADCLLSDDDATIAGAA